MNAKTDIGKAVSTLITPTARPRTRLLRRATTTAATALATASPAYVAACAVASAASASRAVTEGRPGAWRWASKVKAAGAAAPTDSPASVPTAPSEADTTDGG